MFKLTSAKRSHVNPKKVTFREPLENYKNILKNRKSEKLKIIKKHLQHSSVQNLEQIVKKIKSNLPSYISINDVNKIISKMKPYFVKRISEHLKNELSTEKINKILNSMVKSGIINANAKNSVYNDLVQNAKDREANRKAKEEANRKAKEKAIRKANEKANRKAKEEAEAIRKMREAAIRRGKAEYNRKAKAESNRKAKEINNKFIRNRARATMNKLKKNEANRRAKEKANRKKDTFKNLKNTNSVNNKFYNANNKFNKNVYLRNIEVRLQNLSLNNFNQTVERIKNNLPSNIKKNDVNNMVRSMKSQLLQKIFNKLENSPPNNRVRIMNTMKNRGFMNNADIIAMRRNLLSPKSPMRSREGTIWEQEDKGEEVSSKVSSIPKKTIGCGTIGCFGRKRKT